MLKAENSVPKDLNQTLTMIDALSVTNIGNRILPLHQKCISAKVHKKSLATFPL